MAAKLVNDFIDANKHRAKQGSAQWTAEREGALGGSDLANYLRANPYKTIDAALMEKTKLKPGPDPYDKNFLWGHFWEPIHRVLIQHKFNTDTIVELGAIPYGEDDMRRRYKNSPDGIFIVNKANLVNVFGQEAVDKLDIQFDDNNDAAGMLELKAPISRYIDGTFVPGHYMPQVLSNICLMKPTQFGLFSEFVVKRCAFNYLCGENVEKMYTPSTSVDKDKEPRKCVEYRGIVMVFCKKTLSTYYRRLMNVQTTEDTPQTLCDFGACTYDMFYNMVKEWRLGNVRFSYRFIPELANVNPATYNEETDDPEYELTGACCWKSYEMSLVLVKKYHDFVDRCWPIIELSLLSIDRINETPTDKKKKEKIKIAAQQIEHLVSTIVPYIEPLNTPKSKH
jgi:hypothetical protein